MNLSGLTDVYGEFGSFVNIIQKVDILPHERYNGAIKILAKMVKMKNQLSCHEKCMENKSCLWPNYHEDKKNLTVMKPIKMFELIEIKIHNLTKPD